jgi:hypothetical protein
MGGGSQWQRGAGPTGAVLVGNQILDVRAEGCIMHVVVGEKHDMTIFSVMENGMKKRGGGGTVFKRVSRKASNDPRISPSLLTAVFSIKLLVTSSSRAEGYKTFSSNVQINKREEIVSEIRYHDFGGIKCVA